MPKISRTLSGNSELPSGFANFHANSLVSGAFVTAPLAWVALPSTLGSWFANCLMTGTANVSRCMTQRRREEVDVIKQSKRIRRSYRTMTPTSFHTFNQNVSKALTDNANIPQSAWAANPELLPKYLAASQKHDTAYHEANYGHKLDIAQREVLQAQLIAYLDEIALILEAAALRNPDILITSGFDLSKERRSSPRTKVAVTSSEVATAEQQT
jgi:hypothetical protein